MNVSCDIGVDVAAELLAVDLDPIVARMGWLVAEVNAGFALKEG